MIGRAALLLLAGGVACRPPPTQTMWPAGTDRDDGHGELARASAQIWIGENSGPGFGDSRSRRFDDVGGDSYGGSIYGGDAYGGLGYGAYPIPQMRAYSYLGRARYNAATATTGLTGAIEGVVMWAGAAPPRMSCGAPPHPGERGVAGAVVYIEKFAVARPPSSLVGRPVGGTLAKRGCALVPTVQIVTPLPGSLMIHGDTQRTSLKVTPPNGGAQTVELQEAGLAQVDLQVGVTRVDGDDGKLGAAWIVAVDTPFYALTDDAGRFRLDELAPGQYDVTIWQPPSASVGANGVLAYGNPIVVHRTISVDGKTPAQLSVALAR
jgi:hypothetical protein